MNYLKTSGSWREILKYFKKENDVWSEITKSYFESLIQSSVNLYCGEINNTTPGSLSIVGPESVIGESCSFVLMLNELTDVSQYATWSITNGASYASINSSGILTVFSSATNSTITITAGYNGLQAIKQITATYLAGTSTETETETVVDESGNTQTTTTTITTNEDGSSSTNSTTIIVDESGNTVGTIESETQTNSDGSFNSSTTNYNENGDAVSSTNESGDTEGNINTQNVEYDESGNSIVVGYEIDTSNSQSGSKDITGDGVNTEFVPFNDANSGFICHIRFRTVKTEQPNPPLVTDTEDSGSNYLFNILTVKSPFKPYRGFHIRWALKKTDYSNGNLVFGYTSSNASSTTSRTLYGDNDIYDINIIYDPQLKIYPSKFRCESNQGKFSTISANITFETNNLEFVLGYGVNQSGNPYRYSNVQVYEFSITKI